MQCPACGHANPAAVNFCGECGGSLRAEITCAGCGATNPPTAKFCHECGAQLAGAAASSRSDTRSAPVAPLPTAFAAGRYQVRAFLGEGAKKRVYLAHDTKLDRDVAFALIKTEGLDADGLVRVRREAQAMGRLGDQSHIVTIFDTGDEAGAPYIVSQYRAGGSVEDVLAKAEQHRIAPERAMKIGEQVCHALAHAHGRGIVHRDLKPGNVWLDEEGNAALGDFGLAVVLDRSRMTMQGMMVGTVAYMAPEQALGRNPDARGDLYALGAMLYEMVCGRPPFLGDDAVGVISQHINTAPIAPAWHNPDVPRSLDVLILKLLAKSPDDRPESAQDAARDLRRILERPAELQESSPTAQAPHILQGLPWGAFVGRREEMDQLKDSLEQALSGKGSLAMLVGEPGIGKTRLAEEFGVYAGLRGAQVLTGRCYEGEASVPYRPIIEALRQYVRSRRDDELLSQMGPGAPEIATMLSEVRQRFPDIEDAPSLEPEAERLRLFESITQFLRNASAGSPLVLHVDDLHWADKPSLLLLQHVARSTARDRLLIVGAYRDVELDRAHPLSDALAALRRLPNFQRVLLRGLPLETVTELLGVLEPSEQAAAGRTALAVALHRETEGNPFFIREVIAHLIETGKLAHEEGRWVGKVASISDLGIPEGVREVIGRRLSRVSAACNRMLTNASTMTGGFTWDALKATNADTAEVDLLDALEEALRTQLVAERKGDAAGSYDFTHALIRQTLYDELSTPRRVLLHRQIGVALERLFEDSIEAHLAELAHHFYQAAPGGDVEKAIDYGRRAGDRAEQMYAHEEASGHYERAVQLVELQREPDERRRCNLLMSLADARVRAGQPQDARRAAEEALAAARTTADATLLARAAISVAQSNPPFSGTTASVGALREALEALPASDSRERAVILRELAMRTDFFAQGSASQGADASRLAQIDESLAMARRIGDPGLLRACVSIAHAFRLGMLERLDERRALSDELEELATHTATPFDRYQALLARAEDMAEAGDLEAVVRLSAQMLSIAQTLREPIVLAFSSIRMAFQPLAAGRLEEAEQLLLNGIRIAQGTQANLVGNYGAPLLSLRHLQGRLAEMEPLIKNIIQQFPAIFSYECTLAWLYAESGREAEAREEFGRLAPEGYASIPHDSTWIISMYLLTEISAVLGDQERAAELYDLLLPYEGQNTVVQPVLTCLGASSRLLGMMAGVMQRWDDAERHFEDALAFDAKMGARPWLAHTQYNYAKMLVRRDAPGDRARALGLLQEALNTAQELGMAKIIERGLALKLEAQGALSSSLHTSIDAVARAVHDERPALPKRALAPDGTVTIMFSDIEDSTVLTERLGDAGWMEVLRHHNALIREQIAAHDGYEVKTIGDAFMVAFRSAKKGLDCAIAIQRAFATDSQPGAAVLHEQVKVRIGLHAGEAIKDGDDFYGKNVILASRVAGKALGGEILVSSLLRQLVESSVDAGTFGEPREVELKGLSGMHTVFAVKSAT